MFLLSKIVDPFNLFFSLLISLLFLLLFKSPFLFYHNSTAKSLLNLNFALLNLLLSSLFFYCLIFPFLNISLLTRKSPVFSSATVGPFNFQAALFLDGRIVFSYRKVYNRAIYKCLTLHYIIDGATPKHSASVQFKPFEICLNRRYTNA